MAEPGEISGIHTACAVSEPEQRADVSGKRRREDEEIEESDPKQRAKAQDVLFRIIVPSRQIGKVIGKEGHRIQKFREDTKATIKIADAIARHEERVIIISYKDNGNAVSAAENALQQIATLILKLRNSSGATIVILAPNQLPLCASAHESDRVVQDNQSCS